jgi:hypothetical protein
MFTVLFDIPLKAFFALLGETGESRQQSSAPVMIPTSFEYEYFGIAEPIPTKGLDLNDENIQMIREKTRLSLEASIEELKKAQREDPYRLSPLNRVAALTSAVVGLAVCYLFI